MADFLFHKVSEKEKEDIKEQVSSMVDSFSKKLDSLGDLPSGTGVEREEFYRDEYCKEKGQNSKKEFKKKALENAPKKSKGFILSEKKKW